MGRIADLCGEVAAAADEGPDGLVLAPEVWDTLRKEWSDEDIQDAMGFVHDSLLQGELVEAADSLSARLLELLGAFGDGAAFKQVAASGASIDLETLSHVARRVARLEEVLEVFREDAPPDRRAFDTFQRRLADHGLEEEADPEDDRGQ
jgi:hypothetical protein